jgi:hypothetical protein
MWLIHDHEIQINITAASNSSIISHIFISPFAGAKIRIELVTCRVSRIPSVSIIHQTPIQYLGFVCFE